jgi:hypothetical protein
VRGSGSACPPVWISTLPLSAGSRRTSASRSGSPGSRRHVYTVDVRPYADAECRQVGAPAAFALAAESGRAQDVGANKAGRVAVQHSGGESGATPRAPARKRSATQPDSLRRRTPRPARHGSSPFRDGPPSAASWVAHTRSRSPDHEAAATGARAGAGVAVRWAMSPRDSRRVNAAHPNRPMNAGESVGVGADLV